MTTFKIEKNTLNNKFRAIVTNGDDCLAPDYMVLDIVEGSKRAVTSWVSEKYPTAIKSAS